jgi:hypothetical protein
MNEGLKMRIKAAAQSRDVSTSGFIRVDLDKACSRAGREKISGRPGRLPGMP